MGFKHRNISNGSQDIWRVGKVQHAAWICRQSKMGRETTFGRSITNKRKKKRREVGDTS